MVTQKMISVKIDKDQLSRLDNLSNQLGCNRNKLINFAVKMLCDNMLPRESLLISAYQYGLNELGL